MLKCVAVCCSVLQFTLVFGMLMVARPVCVCVFTCVHAYVSVCLSIYPSVCLPYVCCVHDGVHMRVRVHVRVCMYCATLWYVPSSINIYVYINTYRGCPSAVHVFVVCVHLVHVLVVSVHPFLCAYEYNPQIQYLT